MHRDVLVDPDPAGVVDLHPAQVEDETVGARAVHPIVLVRWIESGHRPQDRLAQPRLGMPSGREPGDQWATPAARPQRYRVLRDCRPAKILPPANTSASGATLSLLLAMRARRSRSFVAARCAAPATAPEKSARVVSGRDRPRILLGVVLHVHGDVVELHPQRLGDDLGEDRAVSLTLWNRSDEYAVIEPTGSIETVALAAAPSFGPTRVPAPRP